MMLYSTTGIRDMISLFEKKGFKELPNTFLDLEIWKKNSVGLISLKKNKSDIKAHRISANCLDHRIITELTDALAFFSKERDIRSLILTSSHKVAFSRGAAIESIQNTSIDKCRDFLTKAQQLLLNVQSFPKPVICAVNGLTLGGGLELALACDCRISSTRENVVFGFPETSLGLIPAMGGTQNLSRIAGKEKAFEIISRAAVDINADEALKLKIIEKAVAPSDLIDEAYIRAENFKDGKVFYPEKFRQNVKAEQIRMEIESFLKDSERDMYRKAGVAPIAAALTDFLFSHTENDQYLDGLLYEYEVFCYLQQTEDCSEGIQAMIDERRPEFKGELRSLQE
jgi:enoyl-CoA hydratase